MTDRLMSRHLSPLPLAVWAKLPQPFKNFSFVVLVEKRLFHSRLIVQYEER